jgi:hypothetical protein
MLDVPASHYEDVRAIIAKAHPEAADGGNDPTVPAFPRKCGPSRGNGDRAHSGRMCPVPLT